MEIPFSVKFQVAVIRVMSWIFPKLSAHWAARVFMHPQRVPRPASEQRWFESAKKYDLSSGEKAFEWGSPQGPLVFLLHGWNGRGTQLGAFSDPLVARGYRVLAVDGPAHGESPGEETNAGDFARFLLRIQKELGPIKAVIAHSFGGGGTVLGIHWGLQVEKLVLIGTPARYDVILKNFVKIVKISPRAEKHFFEIVGKKVGIAPVDMRIDSLGRDFNLPALIVHDKGDREVPFEVAEKIYQTWAHSELLATEGLGHRRILKDEKVLEAVTEFIDKK
ncbi:Tropinesterase [compost metagenome]